MMLLPCPWCGPRNVSEFRYVSELVPRPDPAAATPGAWRDYLYLRDNTRGWVTETWYHRMGCRKFITVQRHTGTNQTRPAPAGSASARPGQSAR